MMTPEELKEELDNGVDSRAARAHNSTGTDAGTEAYTEWWRRAVGEELQEAPTVVSTSSSGRTFYAYPSGLLVPVYRSLRAPDSHLGAVEVY